MGSATEPISQSRIHSLLPVHIALNASYETVTKSARAKHIPRFYSLIRAIATLTRG